MQDLRVWAFFELGIGGGLGFRVFGCLMLGLSLKYEDLGFTALGIFEVLGRWVWGFGSLC